MDNLILVTTCLFAITLEQVNCGTITMGAASSEESCTCGSFYQPFCASDGKTYDNLCEWYCAAISYPTLFPMCMNPCPCMVQETFQSIMNSMFSKFQPNNRTIGRRTIRETDSNEPCFCPKIARPVCGSNNVTYLNECLLECDHFTRYPDLIKMNDGECSSDENEMD